MQRMWRKRLSLDTQWKTSAGTITSKAAAMEKSTAIDEGPLKVDSPCEVADAGTFCRLRLNLVFATCMHAGYQR